MFDSALRTRRQKQQEPGMRQLQRLVRIERHLLLWRMSARRQPNTPPPTTSAITQATITHAVTRANASAIIQAASRAGASVAALPTARDATCAAILSTVLTAARDVDHGVTRALSHSEKSTQRMRGAGTEQWGV